MRSDRIVVVGLAAVTVIGFAVPAKAAPPASAREAAGPALAAAKHPGVCPPYGSAPKPPCIIVMDRAAGQAIESASARTSSSIPLTGAGTMFPGSVYQNEFQLPAARGLIEAAMVDTPTPGPQLRMQMTGLQGGKTYIVFLDKDGTTPGGTHSFGPWMQIGQLTASPTGLATFSYQPAPGTVPSGPHTWAIFVNRADLGATVLISSNITFSLP